MNAPLFTLAIAGIVLFSGCGPRGKVLTDTAMTGGPGRGQDTARSGDAAANSGDAAVCSDVQADPHNCGSCGHDCLGGPCRAGACLPFAIAAGLEQPEAMALDDANVYWTESSAGQIKRVAKAGGAPGVVITLQSRPGAIAVDSGNVYWTEVVGGKVSKVPSRGGSPVVIAAGLPGPEVIAVDAGDVYVWTLNDRTVRRLVGSPAVVVSGQFVTAMVLDAASLYYATSDGSIIKVPRHGGNAQALAASPVTYPDSGLNDYGAWGVAVDTANVYWSYLSHRSFRDAGMVLSAPLDGGTSTVLCAQCAGALRFSADLSGIYWTELYAGNIVTLRGGSPAVLASGQELPQAIATDNTSVYWLNHGPNVLVNGSLPRAGAVMRLAK